MNYRFSTRSHRHQWAATSIANPLCRKFAEQWNSLSGKHRALPKRRKNEMKKKKQLAANRRAFCPQSIDLSPLRRARTSTKAEPWTAKAPFHPACPRDCNVRRARGGEPRAQSEFRMSRGSFKFQWEISARGELFSGVLLGLEKEKEREGGIVRSRLGSIE